MRISAITVAAIGMIGMVFLAADGRAQGGPANGSGWLDRPLTNWNSSGGALPHAAPGPKAAELTKRCPPIGTPPSSAGARQLSAAGWLPFLPLDREMIQGDIEILAGMSDADGMCRPLGYQLFVFVGDAFAGTLSPQPMDSRADQSTGVLRLLQDGVVSADFSRFTSSDALCCPSAHVTVRYKIDRQPTPPLVVPTEVRRTRG
jgi:LppP/LprE lipoprotein